MVFRETAVKYVVIRLFLHFVHTVSVLCFVCYYFIEMSNEDRGRFKNYLIVNVLYDII